jgi:hypothetical protein
MAEEYPEEIKLYDHVSNSGIVHLPGRRFPAVAIQGEIRGQIYFHVFASLITHTPTTLGSGNCGVGLRSS